MKTTPKDFFFNLGAIATLYISIVSFLNLAFSIINTAFPPVAERSFGYVGSISWPVATLIIVFPVFILLGWLLQKDISRDPEKGNLGVRRWLIYITLFLAGVAVITDLVILLYTFLNGEIITTGFLLKVLAVLVVTLGVFSYYILELKGRMTGGARNIYMAVSALVIIAMIVSGFSVIGSPRKQRQTRVDNQRVADLQQIQWQVVNYWQQKQVLPSTLLDLRNSLSDFYPSNDPETGKLYEYRPLGDLKFELCAEFDLKDSTPTPSPYSYDYSYARPINGGTDTANSNWAHGTGRTCFERTIDPNLYPPVKALKN